MSEEGKPLVTFALFAYNQEDYIREAVEAALAQDYEPLEVIISDDCSSDRTFDLIRDVVSTYIGPHKVMLNSNASNVGLIEHVNRVVAMSSGDLIVAAAGDDVSYPSRVTVLAEIFSGASRAPLLIHSSVEKISLQGRSLGIQAPPITSNLSSDQISQASAMDSVYIGASGAWNRKLFELFGPITHPEAYEDIVLGSRAAMMAGLVYCPRPLLKYRVGIGITTSSDKFRGIKPFVAWRERWIRAMEGAYLQRVADSERIDFQHGLKAMSDRLELFSCKRRLYEGSSSMLIEMRSNPLLFVRCIASEFASISIKLLSRILGRRLE